MGLASNEGLGAAEAEPSTDGIFNVLQLDARKCSEWPNQSRVRYGYQALSVKGPRLEKPGRYRDLKLGTSHARSVGNQGDERTIRVAGSDTQHYAWPNLRCETKIDQPNFTAWR